MVSGAAVDYGMLVSLRNDLQITADNAALAGARLLGTPGQVEKQIVWKTEQNAAGHIDEEMGKAESRASFDRETNTVSIIIRQHWQPFFAHFVGQDITPVEVRASASYFGNSNICLLTLDERAAQSINLSLVASLEAKNCGVHANSTHARAIQLGPLARLHATVVCSAGGVSGLLSNFSPAPTTDCPRVDDPMAEFKPPPVPARCDVTGYKISNGSDVLSPGVYCGGLHVSGTADVRLRPGLYIIKDGPLSVRGRSSFKGTSIGFYLSGNSSLISFEDAALIRLSGVETGEMGGILMFEDRASSHSRTHRISSSRADELTGTIYLSRGTLLINPDALVAAQSAYTAIVAHRMELTLGPTLVLNANYGATRVPVPTGIKGSGRVVLSE